MRAVAHREEISKIVELLHDARKRRDGWPKSLREDEATRLAALLRTVSVLELSSIDWSFDSYSWSYARPQADARRWLKLFESHAATLGSWAWFAISTLDRSGFVREAAVGALGREMPVDAIPFIVLRTTDWVSQVRDAAESVLRQALSAAAPAELLSSLEVALHAEARVGAPRLAGSRAVLERLRAAPDEVLVAGVGRGAIRSQRWCLRELLVRRSAVLTNALRLALRSTSTALRFEAAAALGEVPAGARYELFDVALADRVGFVRRAAAEAVPEGDLREPDLERLLLDFNRAARAVAQRECARRRGTSAAGFYRDHLGARRAAARAAALLGLAEVGEEDDAVEAVVRLEDPSWRVRLMALRCMSKLAPTEASAAALGALGDSSHKVVEAAASIALRHPSPDMQAEAEKLILSRQVSRRKTGLRLLQAGDLVWQAEMIERLLRSSPAAQAEALPILEKLVTRRLLGRRLPHDLRDRLVAAVSASELPSQVDERGPHDQWSRRRRAEKLRDRLLFGLRSAPTT